MTKKLLIMLLLLISFNTYSQLYKVYGYATAEAGEKELVYWLSAIPSSDHSYTFFGEDVSRQNLFAHSIELEYGLSNKWTAGLYLDFEQPAGQSIKWIRTKALGAHYRFWEKGERPVDLAMYIEYLMPKKEYKDAEEIEFKLILEKDFGFHTIVLNPTFEKKVSGPDVGKGVEFALNGGYYYREWLRVQPGIEFYSKMGEMAELKAFADQKTYVFPSVDFVFGKNGMIKWHAGIGFGLTNPADNIVVKSILSLGFF